MKNIIYCTTSSGFWLKVALEAQKLFGWDPVCWITTHKNQRNVEEMFSECLCYDSTDLGRGLPPRNQKGSSIYPLDEDTLQAFATHEHIAIEMMNRMSLANDFSTEDRKRLFHSTLSLILKLLYTLKLNAAFFTVPPHLPGEYILYAACQFLGIQTKILLPTPIGEYSLVLDDVLTLPKVLGRESKKNIEDGSLKLSPEIEQTIAEILQKKDPWYLARNRELEKPKDRYKNIARDILKASGGVIPEIDLNPHQSGHIGIKNLKEHHKVKILRPYKLPGKSIAESVLTAGEFQCYLRWSCYQKVLLEDRYNSVVCEKPDLSGKFVFLALHYQPERTTSPDGGRFSNQYLVASLLAHNLLDGWRLIIKEHPNQFAFRHTGNQSRTVGFYSDLASLPNTELLSLDVDSHAVREHASAVATITGFIGWEAVCTGTPVLVFGNSWYQDCYGAYRIRNTADLKSAFHEIDNQKIDSTNSIDAARAYAKAVSDVGVLHFAMSNPDRLSALYPEQPSETQLVNKLVDRVFGNL